MNPNIQQTAVVNHKEGPCLVMAVPGSGKTTSLTERVKRLIQDGINPKTILAITFTNKAAKEMKERISKAIGVEKASMMTVSTFHSLCARILRSNAPLIGLSKDFTIYDSDDSERLVKSCIKKIEGDEYKPSDVYLKGILGYLDGKRNACLTEAQALKKYALNGAQRDAVDLYFKEIKKANAIDFNGLIAETNNLFEKYVNTRDLYRSRFKYISVDEVQDTNIAQYELIKHLGLGHKNVLLIGDYQQCFPEGSIIYSKTGKKRIEDVVNGEEVRASCGELKTEFKKVKRVFKKRYSGNLIEIKTKNGNYVKATPGHAFFAKIKPEDEFTDKCIYLTEVKGMGIVFEGDILYNPDIERAWLLKITDSAHSEEELAKFSKELSTYTSGLFNRKTYKDYLESIGLSYDHPHYIGWCGSENNKYISIEMFGGNSLSKRTNKLHAYHTASLVLDGIFEEKYSKISKNYKSAEESMNILASYFSSLPIKKSINIANTIHAKELPLANILVGMDIVVCDNVLNTVCLDTVIEKNIIPYDGYVYDLSIDKVCNYVCNDFLVHNSIYRFRNASPENILQFEKDFDGCKDLKLEKNYRSSPEILKYSQNLIEKNQSKKKTVLTTDNPSFENPRIHACLADDEMAEKIVNGCSSLIRRGVSPNEIAVLYRTNAASRVLEQAFRSKNVKYKLIGGLSFFDRKEVKSSLAILKLICNPNDRMSFEKAVEVCCKGAGEKALGSILTYASDKTVPIMDAAKVYSEGTSVSAKAIRPFVDSMAQASPLSPGKSLVAVAHSTVMWERMQADSTSTNDRCLNISELASDAEQHCAKKNATLSGYLQNISLLSSQDEDEEGTVKLMTLHACKGLEFDAVFISHVNHGFLPHSRCLSEASGNHDLTEAIEEERRLLYVGMTRARKYLSLMYTKNKSDFKKGSYSPMYPSPFLPETGIRCLDLDDYVFCGFEQPQVLKEQ